MPCNWYGIIDRGLEILIAMEGASHAVCEVSFAGFRLVTRTAIECARGLVHQAMKFGFTAANEDDEHNLTRLLCEVDRTMHILDRASIQYGMLLENDFAREQLGTQGDDTSGSTPNPGDAMSSQFDARGAHSEVPGVTSEPPQPAPEPAWTAGDSTPISELLKHIPGVHQDEAARKLSRDGYDMTVQLTEGQWDIWARLWKYRGIEVPEREWKAMGIDDPKKSPALRTGISKLRHTLPVLDLLIPRGRRLLEDGRKAPR